MSGALFDHNSAERQSEYWISTQIASVTQEEWTNASLVVVAAGTNDAGYGSTDQHIEDYVTDAITAIKSNTTAPILFITPIRRGASDDDFALLRLPAVSGIIENVALINRCSVINGFDFPIPSHDIGVVSGMMQINLHPNDDGAYIYAQSVVNALL